MEHNILISDASIKIKPLSTSFSKHLKYELGTKCFFSIIIVLHIWKNAQLTTKSVNIYLIYAFCFSFTVVAYFTFQF